MQQNNITNFLLGVIAIALIVIVGMMAFNKGGMGGPARVTDQVTRDVPGPALKDNMNEQNVQVEQPTKQPTTR